MTTFARTRRPRPTTRRHLISTISGVVPEPPPASGSAMEAEAFFVRPKRLSRLLGQRDVAR